MIKRHQKVKNQYGKILTVQSVNGSIAQVYEEPNNYYHVTKLFPIK